MATVIDLLRGIGEHAAPDSAQALCGPVALPARVSRAVGVAVPPALAMAWQSTTGRPLEAAHAVALAATQIGELVAIMAYDPAAQQDVLLVTLARLLARPASRALWVAPDRASAEQAATLLHGIAGALNLPWHSTSIVSARVTPSRIVVATLDDLDQHLLPYGDRAWRWFWSQLDVLMLSDIHRLNAEALQRLAWLWRRVERYAPSPLRLLAGFSPCAEPQQMLTSVFGRDFRVIDAGPSHGPALVAIWRCTDRRVAVTTLAGALLDRRLAITVLGRNVNETRRLRTTLADIPDLVVGLDANRARIAIVYGVPCDGSERAALVRAGYRLVILLAADKPHEVLYAAQPELVLDGIVSVPHMAEDTSVAGQHLQRAAVELPLSMEEVARWHAAPIVDHLLAQSLLRPMPDGRLQPGIAGTEPTGSPLAEMGDEPLIEMREPASDPLALPTVSTALPLLEPIDDLQWEPTVVAEEITIPADDVAWTTGVDLDDVEDVHWGSAAPNPAKSFAEAAPVEYLLEALLEEPPPTSNVLPPEPTPAPPAPDVESMIARMRRLREQRESEKPVPPTMTVSSPIAATTGALRFRSGQRVRAMPYGAGIVCESRLVDGREQLTVRFPEAGEITLDPAVSAVRVIDEPEPTSGGEDRGASEGM